MCSQPRGAFGKNTHRGAAAPGYGRNRVAKAPKNAGSNDEQLRQQVKNTLLQAALSGRLDSIFPKVLQAKEHSGEAVPSAVKLAVETSGDLGGCDVLDNMSEKSTALSSATMDAGPGTPSNLSESSHHAECDLDQLRSQARQTFREAIFSGKMDKVLRSRGVSVAAANEASASSSCSSSAQHIRKKVRATLEKASRNGHLNDVLAQHRAANSEQQVMTHGRPSQNCRDQLLAKVEDTRDIDQLLLEIGDMPSCKAAKSKRKPKKAANSIAGNSAVGSNSTKGGNKSDMPQVDAALIGQDQPKRVAELTQAKEPAQPAQRQELQTTSLSIASLTHDHYCGELSGKGPVKQGNDQLLEGWQLAAKSSRRAKASYETCQHSTSSREICAASDPWAELMPPLSAMEPIKRKAPKELVSLRLDRPALADAPKFEAGVSFVGRTTISSKRHELPPPPSGRPPPIPPSDDQGIVTDLAGSEKKNTPVRPCLHDGLPLHESFRSIPIWPDTPESTPPISPRNDSEEQDEVLVPIPVSLLAEVQRLLRAGGQPHSALRQ